LPLSLSIGNQVRLTHRAMQRYLQAKIGPYGVTLGMWYFMRALWEEDGLTQAELSRRIGTMEPTTVSAIQAMERNGFVERVRNEADRRKVNIHLTEKGRRLQAKLLPLAVEVVESAVHGFSERETKLLAALLRQIQANIAAKSGSLYEGHAESLLES
jgi:MarR family transcriptional regulator, organic hydroperoxide resistance regulator